MWRTGTGDGLMDNMYLEFRAWSLSEKKMYKSVGVHPTTGTAEDNILTVSPWLKNYIIMQSTGLTDRNNVLIFEGDIIEVDVGQAKNKKFLVTFRSGCFMADDILNGCVHFEGDEVSETIVWHELMELDFLITIVGNKFEFDIDAYRKNYLEQFSAKVDPSYLSERPTEEASGDK